MIPTLQLGQLGRFRRSSGGTANNALRDLILADSPAFYLRHGEASGTVAENEVSADGTYWTTATLGGGALYTGGPTSVAFSGTTGGCNIPASVMPASSAAALTLVTIMKPGAISGTRFIISRDDDGGPRLWQWRLNGANMEWVKIVGGVTTSARAHGLSAGVAAMLGVTVTSGGVVSLFVNGSRLGATFTIAAANYGDNSEEISINRRETLSEGTSNSFSESAGFTTALSDARMLQYAQAAGFAP